MKYFAYGSNMSLARLRARVPGARRIGAYWLARHDLRFHKASADGSAKCDAFETGDGNKIHGALYDIDPAEKAKLDIVEGLGAGYMEKAVTVHSAGGERVIALTYYATHIDATLKPYNWYLDHVLIGAGESGLPAQYIDRIAAIESIADQNTERDQAERSVHTGSTPELLIYSRTKKATRWPL